MAKDPALLWYPGDYLAGTMEYSFEEKGAYMEVLMMQFKHGGPLPEEKIKRILKEKHASIWSVICEKFERDENGNFFNRRLEEERSKRKNFTESRRNNLKSTHKDSHKKSHLKSHTKKRMENENININANEDVIKKNKKELVDFSDYEQWTNDILQGNDADFEQMTMHDKFPRDKIEPLAREFLGLLALYPNKEPPNQHRFRIALMEHIRKSLGNASKKQNGQPKSEVSLEELNQLRRR